MLAGARHGDLAELFEAAGLHVIYDGALEVEVQHPSFEEWWEPFTLGVGPAGGYVTGLDPQGRQRLQDLCRERLPPAPFTITARAWSSRALV